MCQRISRRNFPTFSWVWLLFVLLTMTTMTEKLSIPTATVILGFLLGMPIVQFTSASSFRIPYDSVFGRLSYGLFLIHMPVIWLFEYISGKPGRGHGPLPFVMIVSVALAACATFTIEQMTWRLRKSITKV